MFKRLTVKKFQKHDYYVLDLDYPVTSITGDTESGKSCLLRAIRWLCLNLQPVKYIKRGEKECEAILEFEDCKVARKRSSSINEYYLNGAVYRAFGTKIPIDIEKKLNVGPSNFAHQLDGPFWFDLSPGQVSKELNSIVRLDIIDSSLAKASSSIREKKAEIVVCKERVKTAKQKKKDLLWVKSLDKDLKKLEDQKQIITDLESGLKKTTGMLDLIETTERKVKLFNGALSQCEEVVKTFPFDLLTKLDALEKLLDAVEASEKRLNGAIKDLENAQKKIDDNKGIVCPKCGQEVSEENLCGV